MLRSALANFAETAYHQGIDLFGENKRRFVAGAESPGKRRDEGSTGMFPPLRCERKPTIRLPARR